uniref:Ig-like domain-containing protein n=1 Tax=Anas platyrhynchos platyrhynchos TaxID=8840 RepID=A0A493TAG6_ANAPP
MCSAAGAAQWKLLESGGGLRAPGDSVQLSCKGSGFRFQDHSVWWYRQAPVGSLEWVSYIKFDVRTTKYGKAVEGRVTASKDNSQSKAYLSLHALLPQDSAHYFCRTRRGNRTIFPC